MTQRIAVVRGYLDAYGLHHSRLQPAAERWRGVAASVLPALTQTEDWPRSAADLDAGAAAGIDVATELPRLAVGEAPNTQTSPAEPDFPTAAARHTAPDPGTVRPAVAAAVAGAGVRRPPTSGPRR